MTGAPDISYNISYLSTGTGASSQSTSSLRHNLLSLSSGTFYTITVITVGPQNLGSAPVNTSGYTCTYTCEFFLILCTVDAWSCMDQLVEHGSCNSSIVGLIPRAHPYLYSCMTVSGVCWTNLLLRWCEEVEPVVGVEECHREVPSPLCVLDWAKVLQTQSFNMSHLNTDREWHTATGVEKAKTLTIWDLLRRMYFLGQNSELVLLESAVLLQVHYSRSSMVYGRCIGDFNMAFFLYACQQSHYATQQ